MKEKQEFEKYLKRVLRNIKKKYIGFMGTSEELYLSLSVTSKEDGYVSISFNNNYWELKGKEQLDWWEGEE